MTDQPAVIATGYAAATDKLRDAAKWLLAAAAGVGGVLVAGLQLGSLGDLGVDQWERLTVALLGLLVALAGAGAVIARAGTLLTEDWITLAELSLDDFRQRLNRRREPRGGDVDAIYAEIARYGEELYGEVATSPEELYHKLTAANARLRGRRLGDPPVPAQDAQHDHDLRAAAHRVVDYANYRRTRADFAALQRLLIAASVAVVTGVVLFALATHTADPTCGHDGDAAATAGAPA